MSQLRSRQPRGLEVLRVVRRRARAELSVMRRRGIGLGAILPLLWGAARRRRAGRGAQGGHGPVRRSVRIDRDAGGARRRVRALGDGALLRGDARGHRGARRGCSRSSSATLSWRSSGRRRCARTTRCAPCAAPRAMAAALEELNGELGARLGRAPGVWHGVNTGELVIGQGAGDHGGRRGHRRRRCDEHGRAPGAGGRRGEGVDRRANAAARRATRWSSSRRGKLELKGKAQPVRAWRLVVGRACAARRHLRRDAADRALQRARRLRACSTARWRRATVAW